MNFPNILEFEDKMDEANIFTGSDGYPRHREAYLTTMDFSLMDKFLENQKENYSFAEWTCLREHFKYMGYLSPMNKLVSFRIEDIVLDAWEL